MLKAYKTSVVMPRKILNGVFIFILELTDQ